MITITHATKILKFCNFLQSILCTVKSFFEKLLKKYANILFSPSSVIMHVIQNISVTVKICKEDKSFNFTNSLEMLMF